MKTIEFSSLDEVNRLVTLEVEDFLSLHTRYKYTIERRKDNFEKIIIRRRADDYASSPFYIEIELNNLNVEEQKVLLTFATYIQRRRIINILLSGEFNELIDYREICVTNETNLVHELEISHAYSRKSLKNYALYLKRLARLIE